MFRRDENFIRMADVTLRVLNDNQDVWAAVPPAVNAVAAITTARQIISGAVQGQQIQTIGLSEDKEQLSDDAVRLGVKLARLTQAYALDQANNGLYRQVLLNEPDLDRTPEMERTEILYDLHTRITALGTAVRPYGVTTALLTQFREAIDAFRDSITAPRNAIVERTTHTDSISAQLRAMRLAFKKLDRLVLMFEDEEPGFLNAYRSARIVINLHGPGPDSDKDPKEAAGKGSGDAPTAETKEP